MTIKPQTLPVALCLVLFAGAASCASNDIETNSATAAATLENQASAMEAAIEQECQKVAPPGRPLCREQRARAVQRLRERAASVR